MNTKESTQRSESEIFELAETCVNIVKRAHSETKYDSIGGNLSLFWLTQDDFRAYASVQSPNPIKHEIAISYGAAVDVYREAELFPKYCEEHFGGSQFRELYKNIPSDAAPKGPFPEGLTNSMITDRITKSVLAWIFLHEQAHLFQQHGKVGHLLHLPISEINGCLIDEAYALTKHTLTGESACLRHLFELSADYEAMQYTLVSLIAAEGGTLPMSTLWCFVAGLTCLFRRFFGYTTVPTRGVPSGTHPDPSYRMSMLLRGMSGFLCSNSLKKFVPWIREERDFFAVTNHATVTATMFINYSHGIGFGGGEFLDRVGLFETMSNDYIQPMTEIWLKARPIIIEHYFGSHESCVLPPLDAAYFS